MSVRIIPKHLQGRGAFNGGQIIENKPIGFPNDGGHVRPYSSLFYWAKAEALVDSTIGLHPHKGFEIMSFVLEGRIRHFDTAHNVWKPLEKGDVQIIRAGSGIEHSEHVEKGGVIFQIWTDPDLDKTLQKPASYHDYPASAFPVIRENGHEETILIGEGSPLTLDTQPIFVSRVRFGSAWELKPEKSTITSLYVISGTGLADDQSIQEDDFLIIEDENSIKFRAHDRMEVFRITVPAEVDYKTYAQRLLT